MKRVMARIAIIASMVTAAVPLAGQPAWDSNTFWRGAPAGPWQRIGFLQQRIDRGIRDGSLDRREAWRAQRELRTIREDAWRMRRDNGGRLTPEASATLQGRLDSLSRSIRWMRRNDR
jgi:hypothetical protein